MGRIHGGCGIAVAVVIIAVVFITAEFETCIDDGTPRWHQDAVARVIFHVRQNVIDVDTFKRVREVVACSTKQVQCGSGDTGLDDASCLSEKASCATVCTLRGGQALICSLALHGPVKCKQRGRAGTDAVRQLGAVPIENKASVGLWLGERK